PLPAGTTELPGPDARGTRVGWTITSESEEEELLFIVSREPDAALQAAWSACPKPTYDATPMRSADLRQVLRGTGGAKPIGAQLPQGSGRRLVDDLKDLADRTGSGLTVVDVVLPGRHP